MVTLTYRASDAPTDDRVTKRHLDRIKTWLTRRQIRGVWALEFTTAGVPHVHMLTVGEPDAVALRDQWATVTGQHPFPHIADVQPIEHLARAEAYIAKTNSKTVPANYSHMGKWHGTFGGFNRKPALTIEGTEQEIAPIVRIIKRIHRARLQTVPRSDRGIAGFVVWNLSSTRLTADLQRYWNALHGHSEGHAGDSRGGTA